MESVCEWIFQCVFTDMSVVRMFERKACKKSNLGFFFFLLLAVYIISKHAYRVVSVVHT